MDERYQLFAHDIPAIYAQHVRGLCIDDFSLEWGPVKQPFFTHGIMIDRFENIRIENFQGMGAPGSNANFPIAISNGKIYSIDAPKKWIKMENVK